MTSEEDKIKLSISVIDLVYITKRCGDLDLTSGAYSPDRTAEGVRLQKKYQKGKKKPYQKEVYLKKEFEFESGSLTIRGRADGMDLSDSGPYIEEVKSHVCPYEEIKESDKIMHWGQLLLYGFLITEIEDIEQIELKLVYIKSGDEDLNFETKEFTKSELKIYFDEIINIFWTKVLRNYKIKKQRNTILQNQKFPLDKFREGQRELAVSVYSAVKENKVMFVQAPTGLGKTMGVLFPTLKAMGEGLLNQVFFLTAKNTGKETVAKTMGFLNKSNQFLKSHEITSKKKICFNPELPCEPTQCKYANGYFDKSEAACIDAFEQYNHLRRIEVEEICIKHEVCPFEFSLELIEYSDVIVCDYNYVYDPKVMIRRCFTDKNPEAILLVDETHNMVSRARSMYSAELEEYELSRARKNWGREIGLKKEFDNVFKKIRIFKKECKDSNRKSFTLKEGPFELCFTLRELVFKIEKWFSLNIPNNNIKEITDDYFYILDFLRIWELYSKYYTTLIELSGKSLIIKLICLDVSPAITDITERLGSAVFFSGTLTPIHFYTKSLFGEKLVSYRNYGSPFHKQNVKVIVASYISTTYKNREYSLQSLCDSILSILDSKQGNYLVFCPSYVYLNMINEVLLERIYDEKLNINLVCQEREMEDEERIKFLENFQEDKEKSILGLVVSGGIFGEGIDLVGKKLIGALIVSVGLPGISEENDALSEYYQKKYSSGFEFAYQYPGINQVLQNAGRLIRTETDKGIICFFGKRYLRNDYKIHFPNYWDINYVNNEKDLVNEVDIFWGKNSANH